MPITKYVWKNKKLSSGTQLNTFFLIINLLLKDVFKLIFCLNFHLYILQQQRNQHLYIVHTKKTLKLMEININMHLYNTISIFEAITISLCLVLWTISRVGRMKIEKRKIWKWILCRKCVVSCWSDKAINPIKEVLLWNYNKVIFCWKF